MSKAGTRLLSRQDVAEGTQVFFLEQPQGLAVAQAHASGGADCWRHWHHVLQEPAAPCGAHAKRARDDPAVLEPPPREHGVLAELQGLQQELAGFRLPETMTDMAHSGRARDGLTGLMDATFMRRAGQGPGDPIYYVSGPPAMVDARRDILEDVGADEDAACSESFLGHRAARLEARDPDARGCLIRPGACLVPGPGLRQGQP